jgi:ABC-type amino acid transport substrate-binding protein
MISTLVKVGQALALLLAISTVTGGASLPGRADTLEKAREEGTIRVGVGVMGTRPLVWQDDSGNYVGIEADLTKELVKRLGINDFEYVVTEWSTLIPGLKSGRWDMIVSGLIKTEERIQGADIQMSTPYVMAYDLIIVTEDSPIKSEADLKGKVLGAVIGSTDSIVAHSIVDRGVAAEVKDFNTFTEPFLALQNKQVDAVIFDQIVMMGYKHSMPDLVSVGDPIPYIPKEEWAEEQEKADYKLGGVAVAVRKEDTALLDAINKALDDMDADGTRKRILEKYNAWDELQTREAMMK